MTNIAFTGWSPTMGVAAANIGAAAGQVQHLGNSQEDYRIAQALRKPGTRFMRAAMIALNGVVAGSNAAADRTRRTAISMIGAAYGQGGGAVAVAAEGPPELSGPTAGGRNTTAADIAAISADIYTRLSAIDTAHTVRDLSGNGGGRLLSTGRIM